MSSTRRGTGLHEPRRTSLEQALDSVARQTYPRFEIIVVDVAIRRNLAAVERFL